MTTPPTTPRTAPTTVPGVGEVSRKAYVAGMERITSARFCIVFSREGEDEDGGVVGSGMGSSFVTSCEEDREMNADEISRTKRSTGSARDDMGAIACYYIILQICDFECDPVNQLDRDVARGSPLSTAHVVVAIRAVDFNESSS